MAEDKPPAPPLAGDKPASLRALGRTVARTIAIPKLVKEQARLSYDADILKWSERQAALLRRVGAGEKINDEVDWEHVSEEIEDVGRGQLHKVESLLVQALRHMLKAEAWPLSIDAPSWRADAIDFRRQARRRFVPSMVQRINIAELYADALAALPETVDGMPPLPVPTECQVTLDELLATGP